MYYYTFNRLRKIFSCQVICIFEGECVLLHFQSTKKNILVKLFVFLKVTCSITLIRIRTRLHAQGPRGSQFENGVEIKFYPSFFQGQNLSIPREA